MVDEEESIDQDKEGLTYGWSQKKLGREVEFVKLRILAKSPHRKLKLHCSGHGIFVKMAPVFLEEGHKMSIGCFVNRDIKSRR